MNRLFQSVKEYITVRRQLGFDMKHLESFLLSFALFLKKERATYITIKLALEFATANQKASRSWQARKLGAIRRFALYIRTFDKRTEIPPLVLLPFKYYRRPPYLFTDRDITDLLESFQFTMKKGSFEAQTYYTLIGLIAVTGMRSGEVLALTNGSVDLKKKIITIYESKYRKTRKIPVHQSTIKTLKQYVKCRDQQIRKKASDYFFVNTRGMRLVRTALQYAFINACKTVGIGKQAKFRPRITDLRHHFSIKTLVNCHRKRRNPEEIIPMLSMYLGHENPKHTYWYLTATKELMDLINNRVEKKFGGQR
jgi:integrase/recombinase XerD